MNGLFSAHSAAGFRAACWLFVLLVLMPAHLPARIYKWVDEHGNTHFADQVQGETAEEIELDTRPGTDEDLDGRRRKQQRLLEIFAEERQEREAKKAVLADAKRKRHARCRALKKHLQAVKNARFVYRDTGDPDNPEVLSTQERQEMMVKMQTRTEQWCR